MKTHPCQLIQEEIAWGRTLSPEAQLHVLGCLECQKLSLQFSRLDDVMLSGNDVEVAEDFTARVMSRIQKEKASESHFHWQSDLMAKIATFFQLKPVQITLAVWLGLSMNRAF
jgi:hypothetical protein